MFFSQKRQNMFKNRAHWPTAHNYTPCDTFFLSLDSCDLVLSENLKAFSNQYSFQTNFSDMIAHL